MIMGLHPQYLQQFLNTNFHLLQSQGALSYECRSYIGIMVCSCCAYMNKRAIKRFYGWCGSIALLFPDMPSPFRRANSYVHLQAAARHRCPYLVHLMEAHFLLQGGDRKWLKGVHFAPAKLRALSVLNKLLAHRPWLVTPSHIKVSWYICC